MDFINLADAAAQYSSRREGSGFYEFSSFHKGRVWLSGASMPG
jgi:hypothetical protein